MAITTYSELQSACANWLAQTDLTDRIPEFIALAEGCFNRQLTTPDMVKRATAATTADGYIALPDNFLRMRSFSVSSADPVRFLDFVTPDYLRRMAMFNQQGMPQFYTIEDQQFLLRS